MDSADLYRPSANASSWKKPLDRIGRKTWAFPLFGFLSLIWFQARYVVAPLSLVAAVSVLGVTFVNTPPAPAMEHPAGSSRLLLNGEWQFTGGPDGSPPAGGWQWMRVPHRSREFENDPPASGWYRTTLRVPEHWDLRGSDPVLDLTRVRHYARVYLGSRVVGEHYGMRTPWRVELRGLVEPGGQYELVIYTHNCTGPYAHPELDESSEKVETALDTYFWQTGACTIGVEGDVWLRLEKRVRIDDLYVVTSVRRRTLTVEVTVRNETSAASSIALDLVVTRDGRTELDLPSQELRFEPGAEKVVRVAVPWADPVLWGRPPYGQPVLYFLQAALRKADQAAPTHTRVERFGFREVWTDGERLLLNGQPLMLWGDHSLPYVYERQWLTRKLVDLADGNISIVENHRYDAPPVLYEVADELGVFVVSSNFCAATGQVDEELEGEDLELVLRNNLAICETWIRRDRNHPSILFWDVTDSRQPRFGIPLLRRARELDSTRIAEVTYDYTIHSPELVELIDTYRLFSGKDHIEEAIRFIRSNPKMPVKPIRVGETGIFGQVSWGYDEAPPMRKEDDWLEFLGRMPERNIHGLQTFFLTDQDGRASQATTLACWQRRCIHRSPGRPTRDWTRASIPLVRAHSGPGARPGCTSTGVIPRNRCRGPRPHGSGRVSCSAGSLAGTWDPWPTPGSPKSWST